MNKKQNWFVAYMTIVGPLGNLMYYLQGYEIFHTRSSGSVSLIAFIISIIGLASWLAYGIYLKNTPLIVANAFGVIGALFVISGILLY
jgi:MtN3 and saliva related transmembrane protein